MANISPAHACQNRIFSTEFLENIWCRGCLTLYRTEYLTALQQRLDATLDRFAEEPVTQPTRFAQFSNVLPTPHSIAWTEELFRDIKRIACEGILQLSPDASPRKACSKNSTHSVVLNIAYQTTTHKNFIRRPEDQFRSIQ